MTSNERCSGRWPGRGDRADQDRTDLDLVSRCEAVLALALWIGAVSAGAGRRHEPLTPGDVVRVVVGVDHVPDLEVLGFGQLEVDVDVPARIDDHGLTTAPDEVRSTTQVDVEDLTKEQRWPPFSKQH